MPRFYRRNPRVLARRPTRPYGRQRGYYKKTKKSVRSRLMYTKVPTALPDRTMVKLTKTYIGALAMSGVGVFSATETFPLNWVDDSFFPTELPVGYFDWSNFYGGCHIVASKINVKFGNGNNTILTVGAPIVGVYPQYDSIIAADLASENNGEDALSQPYISAKMLSITQGQPVVTVKNFMTSKKMTGIKDYVNDTNQMIFNQYTATNLDGFTASDDFQYLNWILFVTLASGSLGMDESIAVSYSAQVDYYIVFSGRCTLQSSEGPATAD